MRAVALGVCALLAPVLGEASASSIDTAAPVCRPGALVRTGATSEPVVALTFDDGPTPEITRGVMDALRDHGLEGSATFYMIGNSVRSQPEIAREVAARGYEIGNHTMTHTYLPRAIVDEIAPTSDLIEATTGVRPRTFRSPGLTLGPGIQSELARQGLCNVFTRIDLGDWHSPRKSAAAICDEIRASVQAGDILLLHDGLHHEPTLTAMQTCIVETLTSMGLSVVREDVLINGATAARPDGRVPAGRVLEIPTGAPPYSTVIGQLTVDSAGGSGYATAYPCAESRPPTSDLNFVARTPTSNLLVTRTDGNGALCIFTSATTHIIYDQIAEVDPAVLPVGNATRMLDTRVDGGGGKLPAGGVVRLRVGEPNQAVIGQLTGDMAEGSGYMTAYPCAEGRTGTSDLNVAPGAPTSNRLVARADADGNLCVYTSVASHVVYDQVAALDPSLVTLERVERLLDTRATTPIAAGATLTMVVGAPDVNLVGQLTTDGSQAGGYLTVFPCASGRPATSSLNYVPGKARSGRLVTRADGAGQICIYSSAATQVILDYSGTAPWPTHNPTRLADTRVASPFAP